MIVRQYTVMELITETEVSPVLVWTEKEQNMKVITGLPRLRQGEFLVYKYLLHVLPNICY